MKLLIVTLTQECARQESTTCWCEAVPVTSDNMTGVQMTAASLKQPGTGRTLQMSLAAPPEGPRGHCKGRCSTSCRGGAPDHKRQQQLYFFYELIPNI